LDSSVERPDTERGQPSAPKHHGNAEGDIDNGIADPGRDAGEGDDIVDADRR
jgi:hypothetical protein